MAIVDMDPSDAKLVAQARAAAAAKAATPAPTPTSAPAINGQAVLQKLTGGQTLTPEEKAYLNIGNTGTNTSPAPAGGGNNPPAKDPNEGKAGYHLDAATGVWVKDTVPAGDDPLVDKIDNKDGTFTLVYKSGKRELLGTKTTATNTGSGSLTAERVYAKDTFVNTLKLTFGATEAAQPYVGKLYELVSGFYKSGSTEDEALNLAIREAKMSNAIPEFTKRFQGIFDLEDQLKAGKAVQVPTIAEFFAAEAKMGEVLTNAGLGDLANQEFLGSVIGKGKSVLEVGNLISDVFNTIDNAPTALKRDLETYFPGVDRTAIAKALLTGPEGAAALSQKIKGYSVKSAAATQKLGTYDELTGKYSGVDLTTAQDIANMGYDYNQALTGFGQVAQGLPTFEKLQEMRLGTDVKTSDAQAMLQNSVFGKNAAAQAAMDKAAQEEANRFKASSGILASKSRAAGLI